MKRYKKQLVPAMMVATLLTGSVYVGMAHSDYMMGHQVTVEEDCTTEANHHMMSAKDGQSTKDHYHMMDDDSMCMENDYSGMHSSQMMTAKDEQSTMEHHHMEKTMDKQSTMNHHMMRHGIDDVVPFKEVAQSARPLAIPPLIKGQVDASGRKVFNLVAQTGESNIKDGEKTATYGYNGSLLGPVLYMEQGDAVRIHLQNDLPEDTTFHWHGLVVRSDVDGGPHYPIKSHGGTGNVDFTVHQGAATAWYHPHNMESTASQVYKGLAGLIIIHDKQQDELGLPQTYGVDDIPVVLQDRNFTAQNQWDYKADYSADGLYGDTLVVNGTINPYFEVHRKLVRIRLLNGSNARNYTVALSDSSSFTKIGVDGSLLNTPVERHKVTLVPGERVEILVDFSKYKDALPSLVTQDKTTTILQFKRGEGFDTMPNPTLPTWYMGYTTYGTETSYSANMSHRGASTDMFHTHAIQEQSVGNVVSNMSMADNIASNMNMADNAVSNMNMVDNAASNMNTADKALLRKADKEIVMAGMAEDVTINGKKFSMDRIDLTSKLGSTEIWDITNADHGMMGMIHPFHIHGVQFEVLTRNGKPVSTSEQGLKDTILVSPGETVRIKVKFTEPGIFMVHCHILEHEENGMMIQLEVK